jgi:hypothetical protein
MDGKIKYVFTAQPWQHLSPGGWHFASLPKDMSKEIRANLKWQEEGWGRLKVVANIGNSTWETAIWFDTKLNTYLLPLKAEKRKKEKLEASKKLAAVIWV